MPRPRCATRHARGAFIVNMASTGCGKTLGNARILYALADPQHGMRATYALGLRLLTLQTGRSYRTDLHLRDDELAIRVGGSASQALFDYYQQQAESTGSASVQSLLEEDSHVLYEGATADHPLLSRALRDPEIRRLLSAPMLVCTVDHLVPATESLRAGRQIAPMLRLMSADLILDELDDYDLDDLPALTRLVHWAGMLGTRVLLSSATLPPALLEGMYAAYHAGRTHYQHNRGADGGSANAVAATPCIWVDEFGVQTGACPDTTSFAQQHLQFVGRRAVRLQKAEPLRRGALLPLQLQARQRERIHAEFAGHVRAACLDLHAAHAHADPAGGKRVSFGLVRMANIDPLFDVAQALFRLGAPEGTRIHLCIYHARFPLLQRSAIERQLDAAFDRRGDGLAVYRLPAIRAALDACPEREQVFIVLASPVCEVGRDWDADWAVAEPSSMRSLIQLAGRVQRHRRTPGTAPNVLIFDTNLQHFAQDKGPDNQPAAIFVRPGFEQSGQPADHRFRLVAHRLDKLLRPHEYRKLDALPRIQPPPQTDWRPKHRMVDLEHSRVADCMLPKPRTTTSGSCRSATTFPLDAACAWQYPQAALTGVLPQQQPFRHDPLPSAILVLLPDDEEEQLVLHRIEESGVRRGQTLYTAVERSQRHAVRLDPGPRILPWGEFDLMALLAEQAEHLDLSPQHCAERLATVEVPESKQGWRYHPWLGFAAKR
ncbi:type I-F CRISPR-associated helicase Cas3f [Xanthomonas theicola]|uniref:type I-F CRISPR-associated helicase Cas3f n=1 Tax=Xanthomonas theicola TaxID=56464 RepID=UPI00361B06CF